MRLSLIAAALFASLAISASAWAQIPGFRVTDIEGRNGVDLDSRFGTKSSSTEHLINFDDCLSYNGEAAAGTSTTAGAQTPADSADGGAGAPLDAGAPDADASSVGDAGADVSGGDGTVDPGASDPGLSDPGAGDPGARDDGAADDLSGDPGAGADAADGSDTGTTVLPEAGVVRFTVTMNAQTGKWFYAVKIGACNSSGGLTEAETDSCRYLQQRKEVPSTWQIDFDSSVRFLAKTRSLADDSLSTCSSLAGSTGETRITVFIEPDENNILVGGDLNVQSSEILIEYDYDPPEAPTDPAADPGEGNVQVSWTDSRNSAESEVKYRVYYATRSFGADELELVDSTSRVSTTSTQVTGLDNGVRYTFRVVALDRFDNASVPTEEVNATPVPVNDFFQEYKAQGGREVGGFCAAGRRPARGWALLSLLLATLCGLWWRRGPARQGKAGRGSRPPRRPGGLSLGLLLVGAALIVPTRATATEDSPRHWTLNFRFGTYLPDIDSEFSAGARPPYESIFDNSSLWLFRAEVGYLVTDLPGSIFVTFESGFGRVSGKGIEVVSQKQSTDVTRMNFVPMSVGVLWQIDLLARAFGVPLVPYGRAGLDYSVWWITDGLGDQAKYTDDASGSRFEGSGGTWGYHYGGGLRLLLDFLAPSMAATFDAEMGVNDSYVFAEITRLELDDFGSGSSFILSDTLFSFGLGFDF